MTGATKKCDHCKRRFADDQGLYQHMKTKHPKQRRSHIGARINAEREPSIADELVKAHQSGEVPDWLRNMFPEEFDD